jgi:hypothetical protein
MVEETTQAGRLAWRLPLYAAIAGFIIFTPLVFLQADTYDFLTLFVVAPILSVITIIVIVWLVYYAVCYGQRQIQPILCSLAILWVIPSSLLLYNLAYPVQLRETARWFASSQNYKRQVLAQPDPANGQLKHIEWDGWGWAAQDTNVYLVFDPTDSLSAAAKSRQPGKFNGIPCAVPHIRRLESQWYAVRFYTDDFWGRGECN